ncbi:MAG: DNA polymerase III subunit delta [Candidatus Omnitrophica bacterium]|nr:DNA polymerase III subunit delta [Candidatus Omnitrophota bacterium]
MNYLIIGDDEYIRASEISKIRDKYISPKEAELNFSVFSSDNIDAIMDSLETVPFLASKRVTVVKVDKGAGDVFLNAIYAYLKRSMETSVLVLTCDNAFKDSANYGKLPKEMQIIKADRPDAESMKKWIIGYFKKNGADISREAAELITCLKGDDTSGIKTELDKLLNFASGEKIETSHVEKIVGRTVTDNIFKLVDAINAGDADWAFRILKDLYDQKKQSFEILGYLGWHIKMVQNMVLYSSKGMGIDRIAAEMKYSPFFVKKLYDQAKKYSKKKIERWTLLVLETDKDIKTGKKEANMAIEMLIVNLVKEPRMSGYYAGS